MCPRGYLMGALFHWLLHMGTILLLSSDSRWSPKKSHGQARSWQGFSRGHVNTTHIAERCKGTSFALALQGRKGNTKIPVSKGRKERGKMKNTFCIDWSCHGTQAGVAADCEAAPGAHQAISSWCQTPEANPASLMLSQQCLPLPSGQHSPQGHGHTTGLTGTLGAE